MFGNKDKDSDYCTHNIGFSANVDKPKRRVRYGKATPAQAPMSPPPRVRRRFRWAAGRMLGRIGRAAIGTAALATMAAVVVPPVWTGIEAGMAVDTAKKDYVLRVTHLAAKPYTQKDFSLALNTQRIFSEASAEATAQVRKRYNDWADAPERRNCGFFQRIYGCNNP